MEDFKKYARARDQLYHLVVKFRQLEQDIPLHGRTPELMRILEAVERLLDEAKLAFENGEVLAVQIDRYHQEMLPGLSGADEGLKNPYKVRKG